MKRYCLALDLVDDPALIAQYQHWHRPENQRPAVNESILRSGIVSMEIYRTGNRLFMVIETEDSFSFEQKAALDASNADVLEWEALMGQFQQPLPWAKKGQKWTVMDKIYAI